MKGWMIWLFPLTLILASSAQGKTILGIKSSNTYGASYIGFELNSRFMLYGGADFLQAELKEDFSSGEASVALFVPSVGFKFLLKDEKKEEISPYFSFGLLKSLATVDIDDNSSLREYLSKDDEKLLQDLLSFWGVSPAVGLEYPFSLKFSIGGEIGFRFLFAEGKLAKWGDYYIYTGGNSLSNENKVHLDANLTYTAICLNFRF